jgi:hypothetical protein
VSLETLGWDSRQLHFRSTGDYEGSQEDGTVV